MSDVILKVENISKQYRLGLVGTGTISHDLNRWWSKVRGKDDPFLKVGEVNDRSTKGTSNYVWALRDINFEINRGEVLGIIGKNGAGKSTLLKILSRVTSPTTGEIKTKGRIASLLEVGTGFHPEMTGRENIYLNGAILGMTKAEIRSKIDEIIAFSGCERYIDTPVKRYSSGMTVRLAFSVAAHLEPDILVVDEVLAVGDAEFQKKAIGKMQDISKGEGRTVLFVSHNMSSVQKLCNRCIVLDNGNKLFDGNVSKALEFYSQLCRDSYKLEKVHNQKNQGVSINSIDVYVNERLINHSETILLGDKIEIRIRITINDVFNNLICAVNVLNFNGELTAHLTNEDSGSEIQVNNQKEEFEINIQTDRLLFIPGFYSLDFWLGIDHQDSLYEVKNFISFELEQGQVTKRTKELPRHSKLYLPSFWEKQKI